MAETFVALLAAHVIADFLLQARWIINNKRRLPGFSLHVLIVGLTTMLVLGAFGPGAGPAVMAALGATVAHAVIDAIKIQLSGARHFRQARHGRLVLFLSDQLAHVLTLALIAAWLPAAWHAGYWSAGSPPLQSGLLLGLSLVGGFILTTRAGGFAIAFFMEDLQPATKSTDEPATPDKSDRGIPEAGTWIGLLERTLIFILVLADQFGAIGFLIAAKSILRFQYAKERSHSEIVIIGTLASFTWAILFAWLTAQAIQHFG